MHGNPSQVKDLRQGAPGHFELSPGCRLSQADVEEIVTLSGLTGTLVHPARESARAFVQYSGRKYKVCAFASEAAASGKFTRLGRTGSLFVTCFGRVENCLVFEYVEGSGESGDSQIGDDIGNFLADLACIPAEPMRDVDFEAWCRTLAKRGIFLGRTTRALQRHILRAVLMPIRWDLEYLDASRKNFVYAGKGKLICVDSKHLYPGPQCVSLAKLYLNIGEDYPREDYLAITNAFHNRIGDNRFDDPAYFEFLVLFYSLFFLVANAEQFSWKLNVENRRNHLRRKRALMIIGASRSIRLIEGLWWGAAFDLFWMLKLPGRALRYALRSMKIVVHLY